MAKAHLRLLSVFIQPMHSIHTQMYHSPCGDLLLGSLGGSLCLCNWAQAVAVTARVARALRAECVSEPSAVTQEAAHQLDEYFSGGRHYFSVPLQMVGTDFQKKVWAELQGIPFGTTITYGEQAVRVGDKNAVRAVAAANGANAISIFVPCHRVVGTNGRLTGYGGGLGAKAFLLRHEASLLQSGRLF